MGTNGHKSGWSTGGDSNGGNKKPRLAGLLEWAVLGSNQ
jgi:hypothetical protein